MRNWVAEAGLIGVGLVLACFISYGKGRVDAAQSTLKCGDHRCVVVGGAVYRLEPLKSGNVTGLPERSR